MAQQFVLSVVFNKEHWIYQAHFPQRPVTPGAMVLQVAEDLINKGNGEKFKMVTSKNIRFFNVITPNAEEICFKISYKRLAENWVEIGKNVGINETGPSDVCRIIDVTCDVSEFQIIHLMLRFPLYIIATNLTDLNDE
jgi:3-hydroxymyristoyl/3-hydroxydecanoyl-(acyl carrier protein) dehydratase